MEKLFIVKLKKMEKKLNIYIKIKTQHQSEPLMCSFKLTYRISHYISDWNCTSCSDARSIIACFSTNYIIFLLVQMIKFSFSTTNINSLLLSLLLKIGGGSIANCKNQERDKNVANKEEKILQRRKPCS